MGNYKITIKTYGLKASARTERELQVQAGDFHTAAHMAVIEFFEEPINKKRKKNVDNVLINIKKE